MILGFESSKIKNFKENFEEDDKKEEDDEENFNQKQREMLRKSILKICSINSLDFRIYQDAEQDFYSVLLGSSLETQRKYFAQVKERAKIEGVSEYDILAEDAIQIKKAKLSNGNITIDSTTGRLDICSRTGEAQVQDGEELDEEYDVLDDVVGDNDDGDGDNDGDGGDDGDIDGDGDGDGDNGDDDEDEYYI